jgi:NarL family two-component system response regulator LiaR
VNTSKYDLSAREREVLSCVMGGLSNAEIAQELVISLSTAKFHVSRILAKLNVSNRAEAVSLALQEGLVSMPPHPKKES